MSQQLTSTQVELLQLLPTTLNSKEMGAIANPAESLFREGRKRTGRL